jgi:hypothetical protein
MEIAGRLDAGEYSHENLGVGKKFDLRQRGPGGAILSGKKAGQRPGPKMKREKTRSVQKSVRGG